MLVSQLNFKTLKIEVFQKKIRFFLPFSLSLSFLGKDFSRISPSFLSLRETSHHRFRLKSSPKIKKMTPTTTISSSPFFRSQIETIHTQKYSLSLSHDIKERQKAQKQKKTRQKRGRKNQKKREREIYLFPTNGGEDFASLSLSFSSSPSSSEEETTETHRRRETTLGFFSPRRPSPRRASLSLSLSQRFSSPRGSTTFLVPGREHFRGRETRERKKKKKTNLLSLSVCVLFTLTQTDCLLADVVLTAALLSGIKPEADKVQAIFY